MKTFAFFNIKGGVGKTACAVNLAYLSARAGATTLLWDLDPQGAASFTYRMGAGASKDQRDLLAGKQRLRSVIRGSDFENLDLIPAGKPRPGAAAGAENGAFEEALAPARLEYEHVMFDCQPNLSLLADQVFRVSDVVLCPSVPTTLSLRTLAQLLRHLKKRVKPRPIILPFFCMVDRRKVLHRRVCEWADEMQLGFLRTQIPYSSLVEQMAVKRNPLFVYAAKSPPARAYEELWHEVLARAEGGIAERASYAKSKRKALENAVRTRLLDKQRRSQA